MYTLLLVDDERDILKNLALYFPWEKAGFLVIGQTETGEEALQFLKKQPVDAILCDIRMPHVSGIDFARKVQELGISSRIIFLTAYRKFEYAKEALRYGIRDYLLKPPDFEELLGCLQRIKRELDTVRETCPEPLPMRDPTVQMIKSYLQGNLDHACLQNVATLVGLNPNYLSTYFKEKTGISFSTYLMKLRMEKAKLLLTDPHYSVQKVSQAVGYTNVKNFSRAFKCFFGYPPKACRKGQNSQAGF